MSGGLARIHGPRITVHEELSVERRAIKVRGIVQGVGIFGREGLKGFLRVPVVLPATEEHQGFGSQDRFTAGAPDALAFHAGSGTLAGFQAVVKVTVDDKQIWHWDGCYLLGTAK